MKAWATTEPLHFSLQAIFEFAAYCPGFGCLSILSGMNSECRRYVGLSLSIALLWQFAGCSEDVASTDQYPQRPIKLIVPFGAGGGSDTFSRILVKAIEDYELLPQPLVIINVPGAGGTIGSRRVKHARPDGYTLMQLHEGILTSKYSGRVNYGPEAFIPIASMGQSTMIIGVGENSKYQTLNDLMDAATERPDEVIFSANIGAPSQFAGMMLEKVSPGARFRYSQTGDGAKRFAGLQGGHTDVSSFSLGEYAQFQPAGLRAIALLGPGRHPDALEIPTAIEQGYDVVSTNMQFWWAPKGTPRDRLDVIATALRKAMQTEEVQARLKQLHIDPLTIEGEELERVLIQLAARTASVSQRPTVELPNFPMWVFGAVVVLAILSLVFGRQKVVEGEEKTEVTTSGGLKPRTLVVAVFSLTCLYVATMHAEFLGYRAATFLYLAILGPVLSFRDRKLLGVMAMLAIVLSVGLHYLFTELFVIDLP